MKLLEPSIPSDICSYSFKIAEEEIRENGFDTNDFLLIISTDLGVEEARGMSRNGRVEQSHYISYAAWMIVDTKERFIYYNKGA